MQMVWRCGVWTPHVAEYKVVGVKEGERWKRRIGMVRARSRRRRGPGASTKAGRRGMWSRLALWLRQGDLSLATTLASQVHASLISLNTLHASCDLILHRYNMLRNTLIPRLIYNPARSFKCQLALSTNQWSGRFRLRYNPCVCKSNQSSGFPSLNWSIFYRFLPLKWSVLFLRSWTSTGYIYLKLNQSICN
jgi:hypothetical protein